MSYPSHPSFGNVFNGLRGDWLVTGVTDLCGIIPKRWQEVLKMTAELLDRPLTLEEQAALARRLVESKQEIARLRSEQSLLGVLRELACDPACPPHIRLKAAEAGVQFETPKLIQSDTRNFHHYSHENNMRIINETHQRALEERGMKVVK